MNELYNLSNLVTSGLLLAYGLMFLFTVMPDNPLPGNYRKARYMMAFAYLFFFSMGIAEYLLGNSSETDISLMKTITLSIAASQALLFTLALFALLEVRFPGWQYIFYEVTLVLLLIAGIFTAYFLCSEDYFNVAFYVFAGIYVLLLAHYTYLFLTIYRRFRFRMDNYFSDLDAGRLRWVFFSFFAALSIGITALLSAAFMTTLIALIFTLVFDIFYTFFTFRFINYAYQFYAIERALDNTMSKETETALLEETITGNEPVGTYDRPSFAALEKKIEHWVADKGFTEQGITIDTLASKILTNNKYLSTYINAYKKQTFREWINELRIEESKILLLQYPQMTVNEISAQTGFSDKSHFLRQFKKQSGISTTDWKNKCV